MKKFEYKIDFYLELDHTNTEDTNRVLNMQGNKGWELVSIQGIFWVFKREIIEEQWREQNMRVTDKHVLFWGGIFSNFAPTPFKTTEHEFLTNEHYFMFCKARFFYDTEIMEQILKVEHPRDAKALGRKVKNFDADKWSEVCRSFMKSGLRLKFGTNPVLRKELMKYPDKSFVECSPYDKVWGVGLSEDDPRADDGSQWLGMNWLGQCLDEVRDEFLSQIK